MGLSAKDIAERSSVGLLKRNGISGEPDPIDEGLATRRKMLGTRMIENEVTREELESQKAKNELLQAQIEEKRLKSEEKGGGDSAWQTYILDELKATRQEAAKAAELVHQQTYDLLQSRNVMLEQELERLRGAPAPAPQSTKALALQEISDARELLAVVNPETPAPPTGNDSAMTVYLKRLEFDHDLRIQQLNADLEERREKRNHEKVLAEKELQLKSDHFERIDKFLDQTAPRLLGLGETLLTHFTGGTPPQAAPQASANFPAGVKVSNCPQCNTRMAYREKQGTVICSGCGSEFGITPDPPQQPASAGEEG